MGCPPRKRLQREPRRVWALPAVWGGDVNLKLEAPGALSPAAPSNAPSAPSAVQTAMRSLHIASLALFYVAAAPTASLIEFPSFVYDFYLDECPPLPQPGCSLSIAEGCDCDIADAPLRMFRRSGGDGRVFSLASVDLGSRGFAGAVAPPQDQPWQ